MATCRELEKEARADKLVKLTLIAQDQRKANKLRGSAVAMRRGYSALIPTSLMTLAIRAKSDLR